MKIKSFFLYVLLLTILIGFYNCKFANNSKDDINTDRLIKSNNGNATLDTLKPIDLINTIKIRTLPYFDSTNFDNSSDYAPLKTDWIRLLKLEQIYPYELKAVDKIWIRERVNLSNNFISLILGFHPNENELFTTLVTFTNDFDLIDYKKIAYDEIAEGCIRTESYLDKNKITIFESDVCFKKMTDTLEFEIKNNGEITASR